MSSLTKSVEGRCGTLSPGTVTGGTREGTSVPGRLSEFRRGPTHWRPVPRILVPRPASDVTARTESFRTTRGCHGKERVGIDLNLYGSFRTSTKVLCLRRLSL